MKPTLTLNNLNKLLAEHDVDKIDNSSIDVSCLGKCRLHLNIIGTGKVALNFIKFQDFFVTLILQGNHLVWFTKLSAL